MGSAAGVFTGIPDLTQHGINAALASIAAMTVKIVEGEDAPGSSDSGSGASSMTPEQKAEAAREIATDENGKLLGWEDSKGVRIVTQEEIDRARAELTETLGPPRVIETPRGTLETWEISGDPKSTVTYRDYGRSEGDAIDFNSVPGLPIKRWHVKP